MNLSDELRDVHGLHAFSLLFGYDLEDDTDWTWHDVAVAMADRIEEQCHTCEAMLDCDECLRADASHKELRGLQAENHRLRELCRHLYACNQYCDREASDGGCSACPYQLLECDCGFEERLLELGIEVEE